MTTRIAMLSVHTSPLAALGGKDRRYERVYPRGVPCSGQTGLVDRYLYPLAGQQSGSCLTSQLWGAELFISEQITRLDGR